MDILNSIVGHLYRLPNKTVGGNGELSKELIKMPQKSTLSYDFKATLMLLVGICLICVAYIILLQTPRELSTINPIFKDVYDATIDNYTTNDVTLFAFIWNSITKISCSEHLDNIQNIITTVITQTLKSAMAKTSEIATSTCMIPTKLVSGHYELFGRNVGNIINTAATSMTTVINYPAIKTCLTDTFVATNDKILHDIAFMNKVLLYAALTRGQLITTLVATGIVTTYSSSAYLIYRIGQEGVHIMNRHMVANYNYNDNDNEFTCLPQKKSHQRKRKTKTKA